MKSFRRSAAFAVALLLPMGASAAENFWWDTRDNGARTTWYDAVNGIFVNWLANAPTGSGPPLDGTPERPPGTIHDVSQFGALPRVDGHLDYDRLPTPGLGSDDRVYVTQTPWWPGGLGSLPGPVEATFSGAPTNDPERDAVFVGSLYVGGWFEEFDGFLGRPQGFAGRLVIERGHLVNVARPGGQPKCDYLRVASRGARGEVIQRGGRVDTCVVVPLNYRSEQGLGYYRLEGDGELYSQGLSIGKQSVGIFDMTGGTVDSSGNTFVGMGFNDPVTGYVPGHGVYYQAGGANDAGTSTELGVRVGSHGSLVIQEPMRGVDASTFTTTNFTVGKHGTGALMVSGGELRAVRRVVLGRHETGYGSATLLGGRVNAGTGAWYVTGVWVGQPSDGDSDPTDETGQGTLTIVGGKGILDIEGSYYQSHRSRLIFVLRDPALQGDTTKPAEINCLTDSLTCIDAGTAHFEEGAVIDLELQGFGKAGAGDATESCYVPAHRQAFNLIKTVSGIEVVDTTGDQLASIDALLDPADAGSWDLELRGGVNGNKELWAIYLGGPSACP